jgi:hypothetical protein
LSTAGRAKPGLTTWDASFRDTIGSQASAKIAGSGLTPSKVVWAIGVGFFVIIRVLIRFRPAGAGRRKAIKRSWYNRAIAPF